MLVVSSLIDANTFFLFRENGVEIKLVLQDDVVRSNRPLNQEEKTFLKTNLAK